jgi:hypothetical protein
MTEQALARIWLGGSLQRSQSYKLVLAIKRARVSAGISPFEHIRCKPRSVEGLLESTDRLGRLHFQAPLVPGEGTQLLAKTCRGLGLTYRSWHETLIDIGCRVEFWAPGIGEPLLFHGCPCNPMLVLVDATAVQQAIKLLKQSKKALALKTLELACPDFPEVPPLQLVEDD